MEFVKSIFGDFFEALKSKRVVSTVIGAVLTVLAAKHEWIPEDRIDDIAIFIAALVVGDSLRPTNPNKVSNE